MKPGIFSRIARAFRKEAPLHPIDHAMAKRWVKQRLIIAFPALRNNPRALEAAYRALSLQPRAGDEEGEEETVFEMKIPGQEPDKDA